MKKRIAIVLTLILTTGTFTACTAEEKVNEYNNTSVVSTADVSSSTESSEPLPTEYDFFLIVIAVFWNIVYNYYRYYKY